MIMYFNGSWQEFFNWLESGYIFKKYGTLNKALTLTRSYATFEIKNLSN